MGGCRGGSGQGLDGGTGVCAADFHSGRCKLWFDCAGTAETTAGMNVNPSGGVVVCSDCDRIMGISRSGNQGVGVRTEKIGILGNEETVGQPEMEGIGNVGQIGDGESPDSREWILKAQENQLASAGVGDNAGIDGDSCSLQEKTQGGCLHISQSRSFYDFSGRRTEPNGVDRGVLRPEFHGKSTGGFSDI